MRNRICWILVFAVTLAVAAPALSQGGLRYTITVSKFENRQAYRWWGTDLGDAWGTVMTDMLNQSGQFIVLGETDMRNEALAEQDFAASGRTAQGSKTPVVGQMTPAQLLVKGAITHFQAETTGGGAGVRIKDFRLGGKKSVAEINATVYVVDSTTGQIVASKSVEADSKSRAGRFGYSGTDFGGDIGGFKNDNVGKAMEAAISEAVDFIIAQLDGIPWTGTVALVKDGKVYVNRGTREGVSVGQTFAVGTVDVIRDPETGEKLDESMNEIATLRADSVKEKLSICSVTGGNAAGVETGMTVFPR